jgi:hypothetical protein
VQKEELKKAFLDILDTDREFRLAVAGLIGYKELLERISKIEDEIRTLREETYNLRKDMQEELKKHWEAIENLRKDLQEGFKVVDKRLKAIEAYVEGASLTLEDEARDVLKFRLK